MTAFEKTKLATGEFRAEFIRRRLQDGATPKAIHTEINALGFYSGPEGKSWPITVVYAEKRKGETKLAPVAEGVDGEIPDLHPAVLAVPPEYEEILSPEDVAEVHAEAAKQLKAKQRKQAKAALLETATKALEHEARIASQRGAAKGDNVDIQIDLAPYAPDLRLDGVVYEHGRICRVPRRVYAVLMEQMQRSWNHEDSLRGKNDRPFRRTLADRGATANRFQQAKTGGVLA